MDILVFANKISPRLQYAFKLMFTTLYGIEVSFTSNKEEFQEAKNVVKVSYAHQAADNELNITPGGLLNQQGVANQEVKVGEWRNIPVLFQTKNEQIPFDPFSAAFYMATRYEEYLPHRRDRWGRFPADESLAYKNNFLKIPVVNLWAKELMKAVKKRYPRFEIPARTYRFTPTVDVDNAFAYRSKGLMRALGAFGRAVVLGDAEDLKERGKVIFGKAKDPYDTFDKFHELHARYGVDPIFFFLVADYGLNDKNVPISSRGFQRLIKSVGDYAEIGIHPSFASNTEPEKLKVEVQRLSNVTHRTVDKSRQHFLVLNFPSTYRRLIEMEIKDDYSMGFPSEFGFRAGLADPFPFYDLELERETPLTVHPFCAMEATLKYYKHYLPEESLPFFEEMIRQVKSVDGHFSLLWHSDTLSGHKDWKGWEGLYEKVLQIAVPG